jgi:hypothetical protein
VASFEGILRAEIDTLRRRAAAERERALCCAERAALHESEAASERLRSCHERLRDLHRGAESRHLISAELHELLADRLERQRDPGTGRAQPDVMQVVSARLGARSAAVALAGRQCRVAMVAASDELAGAAQDLELVLSEGPATDAARGVFVAAAGAALTYRWPRFGPAAAELGVHETCAAPLGAGHHGLGALCSYGLGPEAVPGQAEAATRLVAGALTRLLLGVAELTTPEAAPAILALLDGRDSDAVIHRAVGVVSARSGYRPEDAVDLLAARAFADGRPLREVARQVIHGQIRLD